MLFKSPKLKAKSPKNLDKSWLVTYENIEGTALCMKIEKVEPPSFIEFTVSKDHSRTATTKLLTPFLLWFLVLFNCVIIAFLGPTIKLAVTLVVISTIIAILWEFTAVTSETVTIIPKVGICSTQHSAMKDTQIFVPWDTIEDVIINEVIVLHEVVFYLTILVKESNSPGAETMRLVPVFTTVRPRLAVLEKIYAKIQALMSDTNLDGSLENTS